MSGNSLYELVYNIWNAPSLCLGHIIGFLRTTFPSIVDGPGSGSLDNAALNGKRLVPNLPYVANEIHKFLPEARILRVWIQGSLPYHHTLLCANVDDDQALLIHLKYAQATKEIVLECKATTAEEIPSTAKEILVDPVQLFLAAANPALSFGTYNMVSNSCQHLAKRILEALALSSDKHYLNTYINNLAWTFIVLVLIKCGNAGSRDNSTTTLRASSAKKEEGQHPSSEHSLDGPGSRKTRKSANPI